MSLYRPGSLLSIIIASLLLGHECFAYCARVFREEERNLYFTQRATREAAIDEIQRREAFLETSLSKEDWTILVRRSADRSQFSDEVQFPNGEFEPKLLARAGRGVMGVHSKWSRRGTKIHMFSGEVERVYDPGKGLPVTLSEIRTSRGETLTSQWFPGFKGIELLYIERLKRKSLELQNEGLNLVEYGLVTSVEIESAKRWLKEDFERLEREHGLERIIDRAVDDKVLSNPFAVEGREILVQTWNGILRGVAGKVRDTNKGGRPFYVVDIVKGGESYTLPLSWIKDVQRAAVFPIQ